MIEHVPHDRCAPSSLSVYSRSTEEALHHAYAPAAWLASFVTLALLMLAAPMLPPADAQAPGHARLGLDQEPPTLDPHASPSAVTYQIIASVTENLVYEGPTASSCPGSPSRGRTRKRRPQRDVQAAARREVPRRHAVQRRRGEVQLRPHRRSRSSRPAAPAPRSPAMPAPRCSTSTPCR